MISKGRKYDMEIRHSVIETLKVALRMYRKTGKQTYKETAVILGAESERLKNRIASYDYRAEDAQYALVDELDKRWNRISTMA